MVQDIVQRKDSSVYRPIQIISDGNNYGLTETSIDKKLQFLLEPQYQDIQPLSEEDNKFINEQDQKQENQ